MIGQYKVIVTFEIRPYKPKPLLSNQENRRSTAYVAEAALALFGLYSINNKVVLMPYRTLM